MTDLELLRSRIVDVPDFPIDGVVFKDISPLLADHDGLRRPRSTRWSPRTRAPASTKVVGIEARGFLLAAPAAYHLGAGFVPVRKPGKLPGPTREMSYDLEYGSNVLQVHRDAFARATGCWSSTTSWPPAAPPRPPAGSCWRPAPCSSASAVLLELRLLARPRSCSTAEHPGVPVHALLEY